MKAKKSYGQHFLHREDIAQRIAESLPGSPEFEHVLEVGPGRGMLTQFLLDRPEQLTVVEADTDMVHYLRKHYPELRGHIIPADFLKIRFADFFGDRSFALIGNFPYNISSQIVFKMIDARHQVPVMVGMFQREMAERIIAPHGSKQYGVISVLTQSFYEGSYLFTVHPGAFQPPPKVQSGVIRLERKADYDLPCDETLFRKVVKQTFGQRRKMLRNTLKSLFPDFTVLSTDSRFQQRPEQLSVAAFIELTQYLETLRSEEE